MPPITRPGFGPSFGNTFGTNLGGSASGVSGNASTATSAVPRTVDAATHPHLRGLLALNPRLAGYLSTDPGLYAFVERNKDRLVNFVPSQPPANSVRDDVKLDTWCHATSIVPPKERDEEYILVVARGSQYRASSDIEIPLQGGGQGTSSGRILYIGKTKDYLASFVDDNDAAFPGAGSVTLDTLPVFGGKGEKVELTYARFLPDARGAAHPSQAAWPDSFQGVYGGYSGRDQEVVLVGGARPHLKCPS